MAAQLCLFADFELDRSAYELRRKGRVVRLQRIPLDLLLLLVERRGQLVTRKEIVERIWGKEVFLDSERAGFVRVAEKMKLTVPSRAVDQSAIEQGEFGTLGAAR